jgi:hypothetical protein
MRCVDDVCAPEWKSVSAMLLRCVPAVPHKPLTPIPGPINYISLKLTSFREPTAAAASGDKAQ